MLIRIAAIVCLGSCSFAISGPDPNRPASTPPHCETSKSLIAVDGAIAAASGAIGFGLLTDHDGGIGAALLLTSALYAGSALIGNGTIDRCRLQVSEYQVVPPPATLPIDPYAMPARPAPVATPPPPPLSGGDVFHVPLGAAPPAAPEPVQPRPPAPDTAWRQFWREAN